MSSPTIRVAILDEQLSAQLRESPETAEGIEVVWAGTELAHFTREVPEQRPDVIAVSLGLLGPDPVAETERLAKQTGAQLVFALYTFAKRPLLAKLREQSARPLRSPISLTHLRGFLSGMIVRKILSTTNSSTSAGASPRPRPQPRAQPSPSRSFVASRYSMAQLGRLKEIESAVECECPNHLADILTHLVSFERYSADCSSKNEADRAIHEMLHRETARARVIMEDALAKLLVHEQVEL